MATIHDAALAFRVSTRRDGTVATTVGWDKRATGEHQRLPLPPPRLLEQHASKNRLLERRQPKLEQVPPPGAIDSFGVRLKVGSKPL